MATVDDKVVAMSFESSKFESGVNKTLTSIDKLKKALHFQNAGKGLDEVNAAAKRLDLSRIGASVDEVSGKLNAFRLTAIGVFANIATEAVRSGISFAKAFTLDPAKAGFAEYSTNLNAIQTILANTQAAGTNLKEVNAALQELNTYSDKTIYNFSQMARNIGTFTAAGVDLNTATDAIKGIANLAALSGSNSEQASTAMYQLSQAISAGSVKLQDWNSVVNAGMGGTVFQRALAQTAEQVGTLTKGSVQLKGAMKNVTINGEAFRQSLSTPGKASWLTSDVLTKTLKQFTGDLSDAELAAMGFTDMQIAAIQKTAKTAMHAATEVKTISQVFEVAKETAGSGWAQTFQIVFGTFTEAKKTFTDLSNAINGFINTNAKARNKVLGDWKAMGGRTVLISGIKTVFENLGKILKPIQDAFREIFPKKTGKDLFNLTLRFREFADALEPSPKTINNLKRTFKGLFALLDIGKQVVVGIFSVFSKLFHATGTGSGGFLDFTAKIGDWLVAIDEALKKGDALTKFFDGLGTVLAVPVKILRSLASAFANLFSGFSPGAFSKQIDGATKVMTPFQKVIEGIADALKQLGPAISDAVQNMNFDAILAVIRTGLFAGIFVMAKQFFGKGSLLDQIGRGFAGGFLKNISLGLGSLTGAAKAMQTNVKADTLKKIAIAIGILALSILALSLVDPKRLKSSLGAMTVIFGELLGAMAIMEKIGTSKGSLKMPLIAGAMILLATAIDILAIAVIALGKQNLEELKRGLGAIAVLLGGLTGAAVLLSKYSGGLIKASIGMVAISGAVNVLALAVRQLGKMDPKNLAKGLGAVALLLGAMTGAAVLLSKYSGGLIGASIGITAIAAALNILAVAVRQLGVMDPKNLAKGLGAIAISLGVIVLAMRLMPAKNMIAAGAGLLLVSLALGNITKAVQNMGVMSMKQIAKGLITLAGSLAILAGALFLMSKYGGGPLGAASLFIVAAGVSVLAPALVKLGKMSGREIIKSLIALAGGIAILAGAAALIEPIIPAMLALGVALALIGGAIFLAGAGIALIGVGLGAIAVSGSAAVAILQEALISLYETIPELAKNLALGLLEIVDALAATAPKFVEALVKILNMLLDAVIKVSPKIVQAFDAIIKAVLQVLHDNQGDIIQAGLDLILALLKGIKDNIRDVIDAGADIIVNFLKGIGDAGAKIVTAAVDVVIKFVNTIARQAVRMADAGAKAVISFLNGIANVIEKREWQIIKAGGRIAAALITGLIKGLSGEAVFSNLKKKVTELAHKVVGWVKDPLGIFSPSMEFVDVGHNIVKGLAKGISDDKPVKDATTNMANNVVDTAKEILHPDIMKMVGQNAIRGFAKGVHGSADDVVNAFTDLNDKLTSNARDARKTIEEEQAKLKELLKAAKPDKAAIKAVQDAITKNQAVLAQSTSGHIALTQTLKTEKVTLMGLIKDYESISKKLGAANQALADAKQLRDDAFGQFSEQYGQLPEIVSTDAEGKAVDQLATYQQALIDQVNAVTAYKKTLDKLRKLGLDDQTYKKLLEEGTADQAFADQLLKGGKNAIQGLSILDGDLQVAAGGLADTASKNLYQVGVDIAQGVVDGLASKHSELYKAIQTLAASMVTAMRRALKAKSPSEVFAELGKFSAEGLAKGLIDSSKAVTDAIYMVSDDAMGAMRDSLGMISDTLSSEIDANPTITPILDLSHIQNGAKSLNSMLSTTPIVATTSTEQARAISRSSKQASAQTSSTDVGGAGTVIKLEQNNMSPKALDEIEIYRQTKNQLSQLRSIVQT